MKTRFAPSPTGYIHIGNVRSAIYPYLLAKQQGGKFVLRIEDTDQARYVGGATELIEDTLKWLGLDWDEGPIVGGPNEPYFQSERREIYQRYALKLLESGRAYFDPTPPEKIAEYRQIAEKNHEPYLYRNFRPKLETASNSQSWSEGIPLRFKSAPKERSWHDEVMGDLHAGPEVQDDIILIKKDGLPTYNFAHIVDDFEMGITIIMRGVEYLSSMPNYLAIYEALGIDPPKFVSLPHILAPTGNKKLGKRDGAKSVTEYRDDGILPETMLNYLACLGWNDGSEQEIYSKDELIQKFSLDRIQSSGARYDEAKLLWMNGKWLRKLVEEQGIDAVLPRTKGFWPEKINPDPTDKSSSTEDSLNEYKKRIFAIIYDRLKSLSDLREMTTYFFEDPKIDENMLKSNKFLKKMPREAQIRALDASIVKLGSLGSWDETSLQEALNRLKDDLSEKPAQLFSLIRIAISFAPFTPALNETLAVLGRETTLRRLKNLLDYFKSDHTN